MLYLIDPEIESHHEFIDSPLVIDGANVAFETKSNDGKAKLMNLKFMQQKLENHGIMDFKVICDRSLYYRIDERENYEDLIKYDNRFIESPGGSQADSFILQYAYNINGWILSNDNFRDYSSAFGKEWIQSKRISFKIIDGDKYFDKLIPTIKQTKI